uniref:t-SNARE coiled-coil homology domain-containing protein n=1 Tax=Leptobrachium leishanense TaxID=445787 RepID=A0A8C5MWR9_9ANUR
MKDRLEELIYRVREDESMELDENLAFDNPVYHETEGNAMDVFFQEVSGLSVSLKKLKETSDRIENKQEEILCSTTETDICKGKKELTNIKNLLIPNAKVIQSQLGRMKGSLGQDDKSWRAENRIRQSQFMVLTNRYKDIMTQHYINETKYVGKLKEQIMRQAELAGLNLHEEEINQLIGSPMAPQIVGHDLEILKAKHHLAMAQERHKQLVDLEAQIVELHSLFIQMDLLVSEQQDIINSIEYNVLNTIDYISQSNEQVKKALKYQRQSRTRRSIKLSSVCGLSIILIRHQIAGLGQTAALSSLSTSLKEIDGLFQLY